MASVPVTGPQLATTYAQLEGRAGRGRNHATHGTEPQLTVHIHRPWPTCYTRYETHHLRFAPCFMLDEQVPPLSLQNAHDTPGPTPIARFDPYPRCELALWIGKRQSLEAYDDLTCAPITDAVTDIDREQGLVDRGRREVAFDSLNDLRPKDAGGPSLRLQLIELDPCPRSMGSGNVWALLPSVLGEGGIQDPRFLDQLDNALDSYVGKEVPIGIDEMLTGFGTWGRSTRLRDGERFFRRARICGARRG